MTAKVPTELAIPINQQVLDRLAGASAHSDVAEALRTALKPLGDIRLFCPDWQQYGYVVAYTQGVVMAWATGMSTVGLRLDARMAGRAVACGGELCPDYGEGWVTFALFRDDWPRVDLEFWARKAYMAARDLPK